MITDIVIGLQHGDEGKGKVTHHLLKSGEICAFLKTHLPSTVEEFYFSNSPKFI